jgi:hypothetical protein
MQMAEDRVQWMTSVLAVMDLRVLKSQFALLVCVCVCARVLCVRVHTRVCVCVCVCARACVCFGRCLSTAAVTGGPGVCRPSV